MSQFGESHDNEAKKRWATCIVALAVIIAIATTALIRRNYVYIRVVNECGDSIYGIRLDYYPEAENAMAGYAKMGSAVSQNRLSPQDQEAGKGVLKKTTIRVARSAVTVGESMPEAILAYVSVQTIPTLLTDHSDAPGSFQKVEGGSAMRIPIRLGKTVTLRLTGSAQEGYTAQIVA